MSAIPKDETESYPLLVQAPADTSRPVGSSLEYQRKESQHRLPRRPVYVPRRVPRAETVLGMLDFVLYHVIAVPLLSFLPAPIPYTVACLHGDLRYRWRRSKRARIDAGLRAIYGDRLTDAQRAQITRRFFREKSCEWIDVLRMLGSGRAMTRLVELRGEEHLRAALAEGKGAILCSGHVGAHQCAFSLVGALGYPITTIGRRPYRFQAGLLPMQRWFARLLYYRPLEHHRHRPNIEPQPGDLKSAAEAVSILRQNEMVSIAIDAPTWPQDRSRAVRLPFLGREGLFLPGIGAIAQLSGAPILMLSNRRQPHAWHQVLEVSPPIPVDRDPVLTLRRCLAVIEEDALANPAGWTYWDINELVELGLVSAADRDRLSM